MRLVVTLVDPAQANAALAAIQEYIDAHNKDPKPYVWTATAESILAKVARARATLDTVN